MKNLKTFAIMVFCIVLLFGAASCSVFVKPVNDQGRHLGWYKKPYNSRSSIRLNQGTANQGIVNQGTQRVWFKKSYTPNPPGKTNKGKHKGNFKKQVSG